ncbi:MAG: hypothetical protein HY275_07875 [Gemmatimonadetes bacterium]|nr:hypothetical protein [Gemmatimonadota bacterium]
MLLALVVCCSASTSAQVTPAPPRADCAAVEARIQREREQAAARRNEESARTGRGGVWIPSSDPAPDVLACWQRRYEAGALADEEARRSAGVYVSWTRASLESYVASVAQALDSTLRGRRTPALRARLRALSAWRSPLDGLPGRIDTASQRLLEPVNACAARCGGLARGASSLCEADTTRSVARWQLLTKATVAMSWLPRGVEPTCACDRYRDSLSARVAAGLRVVEATPEVSSARRQMEEERRRAEAETAARIGREAARQRAVVDSVVREAELRIAAGRPADAVPLLREAASRAPDDERIVRALPGALLALVPPDLRGAEWAYSRWTTRFPGELTPWYARLRLLRRLADLQGALLVAGEIVTRFPDEEDARRAQIELLTTLGPPARAEVEYRRLARAAPPRFRSLYDSALTTTSVRVRMARLGGRQGAILNPEPEVARAERDLAREAIDPRFRELAALPGPARLAAVDTAILLGRMARAEARRQSAYEASERDERIRDERIAVTECRRGLAPYCADVAAFVLAVPDSANDEGPVRGAIRDVQRVACMAGEWTRCVELANGIEMMARSGASLAGEPRTAHALGYYLHACRGLLSACARVGDLLLGRDRRIWGQRDADRAMAFIRLACDGDAVCLSQRRERLP